MKYYDCGITILTMITKRFALLLTYVTIYFIFRTPTN
nr:MAG TPA_asm: hypothetical protein [Bacteriophage sp.]